MKRLFHSLSRTSDGAFVVDQRHRIVFWNQAASDLLGFKPEEVIGRPCYDIMGGQDEQGRTLCQRFCRIAIMAEKGDVIPNRDIFVRTCKGEGRWLNVTTFAYTSTDENRGQMVVHLFRDVTASKENQRFVKQVLDASDKLERNGSNRELSSAESRSPAGLFTSREWQVLELMARGKGTDEMAQSLTISPSTVRNHAQNILDKMGVHSRLEAIAYAYQRGLIEANKL